MANPYKAFIPYSINQGVTRDMDTVWLPQDLTPFKSVDPSGGQWSTMGIVPTLDGDYCHSLVLDWTWLMCVQFNDRILPGKVRDEKLQIEVARLEKLEGRKLTKKEYAELRDQTEFNLLPKAFIRRKTVPVMFNKGFMLVFTGSQKVADSVVALLQGMLSQLKPRAFNTVLPPSKVLTALAQDEMEITGGIASASDCAVLKAGKKTVRVKDREIASQEVQHLFKTGDYAVAELGVDIIDPESTLEVEMSFRVTDSLIFKGVSLPDVILAEAGKGKEQDDHALALLVCKTYLKHTMAFIDGCFEGLKPAPAEDDDEL
jgi:DNA recombination-dependent growth factor C